MNADSNMACGGLRRLLIIHCYKTYVSVSFKVPLFRHWIYCVLGFFIILNPGISLQCLLLIYQVQ